VRVLFTTLPATGHFNSLLPLAIAAQKAGHEVGIATAAAFADVARAAGLRHFACGPASFEELLVGHPPLHGRRRMVWTQRTVFGTRAPQRIIPELSRLIAEWPPDVIVRESTEYAGCLVAEKAGIPHASVATGSAGSQADRARLLRGVLNARRAEIGLEPDSGGQMMFRYLHFALTPPRWEGDHTPPATAHFIRYQNPVRAGEHRPAWLDERRSRPLVLASLGTLMYREAGLLEAIISALGDEPVEAVVVVGRDVDTSRFAAIPINVRLEAFVPQITVLGECSLFVTHGGFNSTKEALSLGVPLVVIPIGADQFFTAERVEALGLGRRVSRTERQPEVIRARVREVLADARYRHQADAFAADMAALPPIEHAVALLERLAQERRPIPRDPARTSGDGG